MLKDAKPYSHICENENMKYIKTKEYIYIKSTL